MPIGHDANRVRRRSPWAIRCGVLVALCLTAWLAGPRAYEVLAARLERRATTESPLIDLERVGITTAPAWLRGPLAAAVFESLAERLTGSAAIMDEAAALRTKAALSGSPWVVSVQMQRKFPDRFAVDLTLRAPVLEVFAPPGSDGATGEPIAWLDRDGVVLPASGTLGLPRTHARMPIAKSQHGKLASDARLVAAAAVAAEWNERLLPLCRRAVPRLVEVDASNLGYRYIADGRYAEVQVALARPDGSLSVLAYGHPPGSRWPRVRLDDMARVLDAMLEAHPLLADVERGDLRFANRWRDWIVPSAPRAPRGT